MRSGLWLAIGALAVHLLWIVWVILGAVWTRNRRVLSVVHVLSLLYSMAIELLPWPCPLTLLEQWLRVRAGAAAYEGSFLVHYLEAWIYPDVPEKVLVPAAIAVCCFNLAVYLSRAGKSPAAGQR